MCRGPSIRPIESPICSRPCLGTHQLEFGHFSASNPCESGFTEKTELVRPKHHIPCIRSVEALWRGSVRFFAGRPDFLLDKYLISLTFVVIVIWCELVERPH